MKRMQVIVDDWQYDWLKEQDDEADSKSKLVRTLLTEAIERRRMEHVADDPLWGIIGLGEGPDDGITSECLDDFLYRKVVVSDAGCR